jgi:hypothetical protein
MLTWKRAKSDLARVLEYQTDLSELWKFEDAAAETLTRSFWSGHGPHEWQRAVQRRASQEPTYQVVRDRVARLTDRLKRIARQNGVASDMQSFPAPAVGGPVISINLFDAVLNDNSHRSIDRQWVIDALNKTRGAAAERVETEFWRLVNPLHWLWEALVLLLRLPFILIEATGFDVAKVEELHPFVDPASWNQWAKDVQAGAAKNLQEEKQKAAGSPAR